MDELSERQEKGSIIKGRWYAYHSSDEHWDNGKCVEILGKYVVIINYRRKKFLGLTYSFENASNLVKREHIIGEIESQDKFFKTIFTIIKEWVEKQKKEPEVGNTK